MCLQVASLEQQLRDVKKEARQEKEKLVCCWQNAVI